MSHEDVYQRLRSHLAYLKLTAAAEALAGKLDGAQKAKPSYTVFAEDLLATEVESTERRSDGRAPAVRPLPGDQAPAQAAGQGQHRLADPWRSDHQHVRPFLHEAQRCETTTLRFFAGPQLLICDELGYLPLLAEAASAIFQVISHRVEQGSMIVTTNRSIASWGEIFSDQMMAAAILDRFLYRATLLSINGDSYRMRAHRERLAQLRTGIGAPHTGSTEPAG